MSLEEFMKTDTYKNADCIEFIGSDGMKVEYDDCLLNVGVRKLKCLSGYLTIQLETI